mmetsp:Transcript_23611/g.57305  ORF Transcript_23611/g.57305 Transcript_23611/m.57305 type:complete len:209 (-) Transcript_23611:490-1116(-)
MGEVCETLPALERKTVRLSMSDEEWRGMLQEGLDRRTTRSTSRNDVSSRSHCILSIEVKRDTTGDWKLRERLGGLTIVDLAGNEEFSGRWSKATTDNENEAVARREAVSINQSLSALNACLRRAASRSKRSDRGPWRNVAGRRGGLSRLCADKDAAASVRARKDPLCGVRAPPRCAEGTDSAGARGDASPEPSILQPSILHSLDPKSP